MSWVDATDEQRRAWLQQGRVPLDYPEPVAADWPDVLAIVERVNGSEARAKDRHSDGAVVAVRTRSPQHSTPPSPAWSGCW